MFFISFAAVVICHFKCSSSLKSIGFCQCYHTLAGGFESDYLSLLLLL